MKHKFYNISGVSYARLQLDVVVECYEKALALKPDYTDVHNNLVNVRVSG